MINTECICRDDTIEGCDIFEFMSKYVGLSVLHPGGFESTNKLIEKCKINNNSHVLDIACGKGTTSILIAKKFKCQEIGIDINSELINDAKKLAKKHRVDKLIEFQVGDATRLPFNNSEFDVIIAQAMLILIENKDQVIREVLRVLKPDGIAGWIELTWQEQPSAEFMRQVSEVICAYCMLNVRIEEKWNDLFLKAGAKIIESEIFPMYFNGIKGMIKDEGFRNSIGVIKKYITDVKVRSRMNTMNRFFKNHEDIFGYGIFTMIKRVRNAT